MVGRSCTISPPSQATNMPLKTLFNSLLCCFLTEQTVLSFSIMVSIDHYVRGIVHGSFQDNHTLLWRNKEVTVATLQTCYFLLHPFLLDKYRLLNYAVWFRKQWIVFKMETQHVCDEVSGGCPVLQFLLLIFSCLRKAAWDYGRLALLMENDRWFHFSLSIKLEEKNPMKNTYMLISEPCQHARWRNPEASNPLYRA